MRKSRTHLIMFHLTKFVMHLPFLLLLLHKIRAQIPCFLCTLILSLCNHNKDKSLYSCRSIHMLTCSISLYLCKICIIAGFVDNHVEALLIHCCDSVVGASLRLVTSKRPVTTLTGTSWRSPTSSKAIPVESTTGYG